MNNIDKEIKFLNISKEQNDNAKIETLGKQSLQIILPCGCKQTQHFFCGNPKKPKEINPNYDLQLSNRFQWFEFCKVHD